MILLFLWYMRYHSTSAATENDFPTEFPALQRVVSQVRKLSASSACLLQNAGLLSMTLLNREIDCLHGSYSSKSQGGVGFEIMVSAETRKGYSLFGSSTSTSMNSSAGMGASETTGSCGGPSASECEICFSRLESTSNFSL